MAETFFNKQSAPGATTLTDLYTVPAATSAVISSLVVCNRGAATSFRVSLAPLGAADATSQYTYYDVAIGANDSLLVNPGWALVATDKIRVYATLATLTFTITGSQIT